MRSRVSDNCARSCAFGWVEDSHSLSRFLPTSRWSLGTLEKPCNTAKLEGSLSL